MIIHFETTPFSLFSQQISRMKLAHFTWLVNNSNKNTDFKYRSCVQNEHLTAGNVVGYNIEFHHQNKGEVTGADKE
jgi:hypothetical protein